MFIDFFLKNQLINLIKINQHMKPNNRILVMKNKSGGYIINSFCNLKICLEKTCNFENLGFVMWHYIACYCSFSSSLKMKWREDHFLKKEITLSTTINKCGQIRPYLCRTVRAMVIYSNILKKGMSAHYVYD